LREHRSGVAVALIDRRARHKRKISIAAINSLPGKNCLVAAIGRCSIAVGARAQRQNRKGRAETETWHRIPPQYLAARGLRPTMAAHGVV
jgi:hypothetical protein